MLKEKKFTLIEHLNELRYRLVVCITATSFFSLISYRYARVILEILTKPVEKLVFISPLELFMVYLKIAVIGGLILASPVVFYQLWKFVSSALMLKEKRYVRMFLPASLLLFIGGCVFAFIFVVPYGTKFLLSFATEKIVPMISVSKYVSFAAVLIFASGLAFELPVVVVFLTRIGLVNPVALRRQWKYIVVLIFVIAAVITPTPDVFTQCMLAVPMLVLYVISIWIATLIYKRRSLDANL
ncbi:MAG: twin-arginine translocase subunit TatC [Candidatus Omnitrophica bacterium]|nr:twin-arginine translocase subunit TatC [Candidatus Omnitrophota bacterium]